MARIAHLKNIVIPIFVVVEDDGQLGAEITGQQLVVPASKWTDWWLDIEGSCRAVALEVFGPQLVAAEHIDSVEPNGHSHEHVEQPAG